MSKITIEALTEGYLVTRDSSYGLKNVDTHAAETNDVALEYVLRWLRYPVEQVRHILDLLHPDEASSPE